MYIYNLYIYIYCVRVCVCVNTYIYKVFALSVAGVRSVTKHLFYLPLVYVFNIVTDMLLLSLVYLCVT